MRRRVASGCATPALATALPEAERRVTELSAEVESLTATPHDVFTPPPRAWVADRVKPLNDVLVKRTEASGLALRRLVGPITLTPVRPEVGRAYYRASCKLDCLNLLQVGGDANHEPGPDSGPGSNSFAWWRRRESKAADATESAGIVVDPADTERARSTRDSAGSHAREPKRAARQHRPAVRRLFREAVAIATGELRTGSPRREVGDRLRTLARIIPWASPPPARWQ